MNGGAIHKEKSLTIPAIGGRILHSPRLIQFFKFCLVGGSGVFVDMGILFLLADPKSLGLNITLSKVIAAETALANNFVWNELWTFRDAVKGDARWRGLVRRFIVFNAVCGIGIFLAVIFLHSFHTLLEWNLYFSNMLAIILVTFWNFGMNSKFNWRINMSH